LGKQQNEKSLPREEVRQASENDPRSGGGDRWSIAAFREEVNRCDKYDFIFALQQSQGNFSCDAAFTSNGGAAGVGWRRCRTDNRQERPPHRP
jgi:hypothetical protein